MIHSSELPPAVRPKISAETAPHRHRKHRKEQKKKAFISGYVLKFRNFLMNQMLLYTGLLIGCGKNGKLCGTYRSIMRKIMRFLINPLINELIELKFIKIGSQSPGGVSVVSRARPGMHKC